jgi:heterodisulfide reductase subunit B
MNTKQEVALELVGGILKAARGADAVATVCPMCQMNLEAYQAKVAEKIGDAANITIVYLPQLLGLAMGLSEKDVRLDLNLAVVPAFRTKLA